MKPPYALARFLFRGATIFCFFFSLAASEGIPANSSSYTELRKQLSATGATPAVLETADALAEAGLYQEAIEVLKSFLKTSLPASSVQDTGTVGPIEKKWRIAAGVDYYRLEDLDTAVMTREEYQEYQRLMQTPLSFWGRGRCTVDFNRRMLKRIEPEVYVSNYRSSVELPARLNIIDNRIGIEASVKGGKWFQEDAADTQFNPAGSYSSDMGGLSVRIAPEHPSDKRHTWSWTTPVGVDWEHYRHDRTGYESFVQFRFNPALEYRRSGAVSFSVRISGDAQYENYYRPESDTLDVVRGILQIDNTLRADAWRLQPRLEWLADRYVNAASPGRVDRWKASLRAEQGSQNLFSPRIAAHALHEREQYYNEHRTRPGTEVCVIPSLRINAAKTFTIEPELSYKRRWAELDGNYYLWQAFSRIDALLRAGLSLEWLDGTFFTGFRGEDVDHD
ncbi:MAG: hypothetical protein JXA18_16470, partial [Chitinispirillaceae bacterium]|nr:hypothetical protein [Chitinispirillaceae bacterium]